MAIALSHGLRYDYHNFLIELCSRLLRELTCTMALRFFEILRIKGLAIAATITSRRIVLQVALQVSLQVALQVVLKTAGNTAL